MNMRCIMAWFCLIPGLLLLPYGCYKWVQGAARSSWPEAEAVVVFSEPTQRVIPHGRYYAEIGYDFAVAGETIRTRGVILRIEDHRHEAQIWVNQFPLGKRIDIRYDPDEPTRSYPVDWSGTFTGVHTVVLPVAGIFLLCGLLLRFVPARFARGDL
jgi:hypothetical protein